MLATGYGCKRCPSIALFNYSTWSKIQMFITELFLIELYVWNIELNILDLSVSLFKTERRCLDFCLKIFITASKKVLSIGQTHSITTYLDQVQMFLLPQIYSPSQTRQRVRIFFAAIISTASYRTNWFNMWSTRIVLILEIFNCLQRVQGYLKTDAMEQYLQTRCLLPLHCKVSLPRRNFFIACMDAGFSQGGISWNTLVECARLHHK